MKGMNRDDQAYAGDFGTPEQEILEGTSEFDWESCMTMNRSWGFKSFDHDWKTTDTLIHNLIDVAAKGGNYLLNVGPTAEGIIPAPSVDRLTLMGAWLRTNGEAIYATDRLTQFREGDSVFFTKKPDDRTVYATLTEWPEGNEIRLTRVAPDPDTAIHLLGYAHPLPWRTEAPTTVITLPDYAGPLESQIDEPTTTITLPDYTRPLEWRIEGPTTVITLPAAARASSEHAWVLRLMGQEVAN
jgi:alpha-L-fucosidase